MVGALLMRLCLLRADPQDLPTSPVLLALALAAHLVLDVLTLLDAYSPARSLVGATVDTLLLIAVVHTTLLLRNLGHRTIQTLTALAFVGAIFSAVASLATITLGTWIPAVAVWGAVLLWYLVVFGHIARHALSLSFPAGVAIALGYFLLSVVVTGSVMGEPDLSVPGPNGQ